MYLQIGDILLVKGDTVYSSAIRWFLQSPYTHAALYVGGGWMCEIDINKRLGFYPLMYQNYDVYRCREGLCEEQKKRIFTFLLEKIDQNPAYDFWHVASFVFERLIKLPVIIDDQNKFFCTEIIDNVYQHIGIDLLPDQQLGHITPKQIPLSPVLARLS